MSFGANGRPVYLAGMMGSGKSTVGRALARRMGAVFVDLDARIEHLFGRTIASLFELGEPQFRATERDALLSLLAEPGFRERAVVVALGGGTVLDPENLVAMHETGATVYLRLSTAALARRLGGKERAARPVLRGLQPGEIEERLSELLAHRRASYEACQITIDGEAEPDAVASRVVEALEEARAHG